MQGDQPHYNALMKIAEGNHDAAIFFCGMLSVTSSDYFLCRLLEAYGILNATAEQFVADAKSNKAGPSGTD